MLRILPLLLAITVGCADDGEPVDDTAATGIDPDTDTTDTDTPTVEPCAATVASVVPGNNAEADVDTTVVATFSEAITADDPYAITLTRAGTAVAGTLELAADGLSATFTPSAPLAYDTAYDVSVDVCDGGVQGGFTTLPAPIDATVLPGRTYGVAYEDVVFTEPGNTSLLTLDIDYILVQIAAVDVVAETIDAVATTATDRGGIEIDCAAAVDAPTSDFSTNPVFQVGPADVTFPYGDGSVTIEAFEMSAQFDATASTITDVKIAGLIDPEQILGVDCALAAAFVQGTCVPCPSGASDCLVIEAEADEAAWMPSVDVIGTCAL